ncbi:hypothetical protein FIA58_004890 [Flavobacterium jejuense]|uniref:Immunity MXAN-0049 protein domain-containing protein n=1 Tax=Flavobacterium jejuense TaxID=1544455 RepID=A0ABX0IQD2_9FLAO|nr:DUF1629 domain-containing protein [Flavobacterium jejuense]NHN25009.1 hypothetical protein [Flavobacterium jejuense]
MIQDTLIDGARSLDGVPDSMDPLEWIQGKIMPAPAENLVLDLSLESGDYRGHIIDGFLTLYHRQLKEALTHLGVDNIAYFPVRIRDQNTDSTEDGYFLANIIGRIDCIDMEKSKIKRSPSDIDESDFEIQSLAIDESKTNGAKIFRLYSDPTLVIINQELKDYFDQTDMLVGVELLKTEDYSEW